MRIGKTAHLGEVTALRGECPALDASQHGARLRRWRSDERQLLAGSVGTSEPIVAQVVASALQQRDACRAAECRAHERQILGEQLILERARAGGDEHTRAREQRRYQIGKGLARASAGLDDQRFARRQRVAHALRHVQLFASHLEIGERPRERAVLTEYVL